MKRFALILLALLMLVSCGAPAETTANADTDTPQTNDVETNPPENTVSEADLPSAFEGIAPLTDGMYKLNFENGYSVGFKTAGAEAFFAAAKEKGYPGSLVGLLASSALMIENEFFSDSEYSVKVGETVEKGQAIGTVGDSSISELADEPHLHFGVKVDGVSVNPLDYISEESKKASLGINDV